jgi:hypothetical protein
LKPSRAAKGTAPSHPGQAPPPAHYALRDGISGGPSITVAFSDRRPGKRQVTKLVQNDEAETGRIIGEAPLLTLTGFAFKPIDEIHNVEEPSARAVSDAGPRDIAMARWLLPVPVPSMSKTLRCPATPYLIERACFSG